MIDVIGLQRKTERYEFADGMRDFQTALWMVVFGFYAWLIFDMQSSFLRPVVELARSQGALFALLVMFTLAIGIPFLLLQGGMMVINRYVRPRWLWRNTGMITAKRWIVPRWMMFASFAVMIVVFLGGILVAMQLNDFLIIFRGIFVGMGAELALMYALLARRLNLPRYTLVAIVGLIGTLVLVALPVTVGTAGLLASVLWAGLLIISGGYGVRQVALEQERLSAA